MTGTIRTSILLLLIVILSGCVKTTCISPNKCEKKVDWNNPGFTVIRTIITNKKNVIRDLQKIWKDISECVKEN